MARCFLSNEVLRVGRLAPIVDHQDTQRARQHNDKASQLDGGHAVSK